MIEVRVCEIFSSIQGESHWTGYPCAFVRLTGCNLDCSYCDTRYARSNGEWMSVARIVEAVERQGLRLVEVTGGEPLLQEGTPALLTALVETGRTVLLETNGSLPLGEVPRSVCVVMDLKAPGSGMVQRNRWENLDVLKPSDEIKVVCRDRNDYEWTKETLRERHVLKRVRVSLSAAWGELDPAKLARWILEDRLDLRLQLQLHRVLWPNVERGV